MAENIDWDLAKYSQYPEVCCAENIIKPCKYVTKIYFSKYKFSYLMVILIGKVKLNGCAKEGNGMRSVMSVSAMSVSSEMSGISVMAD